MQIDTMLGHSIAGTKKHYIHFKPDYLEAGKHAIENYLSEVDLLSKRIQPANVPPTCYSFPYESVFVSKTLNLNREMVGGIGIEPTTTTMST